MTKTYWQKKVKVFNPKPYVVNHIGFYVIDQHKAVHSCEVEEN